MVGGSDQEDVLAQEERPEGIYDKAIEEGYERLERTVPDLVVTASIAGGEILFGAITALTVTAFLLPLIGRDAASIAGALVFPLGFVLVLIGRSELFTENFLIPIAAVLRAGRTRNAGTASGRLGRLWGVSLVFNLLGALVSSLLLTRAGVLPEGTIEEVRHLAADKVSDDFPTAFYSAVLAGALMTLLTWLLLSVRELGAKIAIIFLVGFVIELHHFNHAIVSAGQIFMAMLSGGEITPQTWLTRNFAPAVLGNVIGGVGLVTGLRVLQVWTEKKREPVTD